MKILGIVGDSDSGKTGLISRLIPELKARGLSVAVIKSCPHGFDLDLHGKDTWTFVEAGSDGVAMFAPDRLAVFQKTQAKPNVVDLALHYFASMDIVLVEGGKKQRGYKKIEIWKDDVPPASRVHPHELIAVVSNREIMSEKPNFLLDQLHPICDYIIKNLNQEE